MIWFVILTIFIITGLTTIARRVAPFPICPICVGVSLTWIGLLTASFAGYPLDTRIPAILMGGSIVGIAYQAGQLVSITRSEFLWKSLFIPIGFALVFTVLDRAWMATGGLLIVIIAIVLWFFLPWFTTTSRSHEGQVESLENKMKNCC